VHHLERLRAEEKNRLTDAGELTAARIAQRFAPLPQWATSSNQAAPPEPPRLVLTVGTRTLLAALIFIALLPSLTMAPLLWLTVIHTHWSSPTVQSANPSAPLVKPIVDDNQPKRTAQISPVLTTPATLEAKASEDVVFPIALDGTDGVPSRSSIVIDGLPAGATLSNGRSQGTTRWNLKSDDIGELHLVLPETAQGESKLGIHLVAPDGEVIASTGTILNVVPNPEAARLPPMNSEENPELTEAQRNVLAQGIAHGEANLASPQSAGRVDGDQVTLNPSAPSANDDVNANWIEPSTYVNLRERPSSSAPVITVVAKGTKLKLVGRKHHRWVQVTDPATGGSGWIYARNLGVGPRMRRFTKRAAHSASPPESDSFWTSVGQWLTSP
jgi:hypothetical protein